MSPSDDVRSLLSLITSAAEDAMKEYEKADAEGVPSLHSTEPHPLDAMQNTVALKRSIRTLEGACDQLCTMLAPPAHTLFNRGQDYDWACFHVVVEKKIADILQTYPHGLHVSELSRIVSIEQGKLARILRLLATRHCFREVQENVFANNRLSIMLTSSNTFSDFMRLLTTDGPTSSSFLWEHLTDPRRGHSYDAKDAPFMLSVRDEGVQGSFYDWQKLHPERRAGFGKAMIGMSKVIGSLDILQHFPFDRSSTLCDVGSGVGGFAIPLAKTYPHIKITMQDLPATMELSKQHWMKEYPEGIEQQRVEFVPLDFFESSPLHGQDIYYLRNIVHNWPDEPSLAILRSVRKAMAPNSRVLIHEYIMQHASKASTAQESGLKLEEAPPPMLPNFGIGNIRSYNQDLVMLLTFNSRERTLQEMVDLGARAGLKLEKAWDLAEMPLLEFVPVEG